MSDEDDEQKGPTEGTRDGAAGAGGAADPDAGTAGRRARDAAADPAEDDDHVDPDEIDGDELDPDEDDEDLEREGSLGPNDPGPARVGRPILPPSDEQPIVFLSESGDFSRVPPNDGNGHGAPSWPPAEALEPEERPRRRRAESFDPIARFPIEAPEVLLPEPDLPAEPADPLLSAPALELRTPPEELETFARARVEAWARVGQPGRARAVADALELARSALRRAMGAREPS